MDLNLIQKYVSLLWAKWFEVKISKEANGEKCEKELEFLKRFEGQANLCDTYTAEGILYLYLFYHFILCYTFTLLCCRGRYCTFNYF